MVFLVAGKIYVFHKRRYSSDYKSLKL